MSGGNQRIGDPRIGEHCPHGNETKGWRNSTRIVSLYFLSLAISGLTVAQQAAPSITSIESLIRTRQYDQALLATQKALKQKPSESRLWTLEGIILSIQGKGSEAQTAFQKALLIAPQYIPALKGEVQILYSRNDKKAIALLERILKIDATDRTAHEMLAILERREDKCETAVQHFAASQDAIENHTESLEAYGYCLVQLKRYPEAIPVFEKLVIQVPDRVYPKYDLALVQGASNHNEDALKTLEPLLTPDQSDPDILSLASQVAEATKDTPRAVSLLRQAIVLSPTTQDYYVTFATMCLDHDSFQAGIEMITAGLSHIPDAANLYISRGLLYAQLSEYDKAEADFARAEQLDASQGMSSYAGDLAEIQKNNPNEALRRVRLHIKDHPDNARLHYLLAQLLMNTEPEPDSDAYREALKEDLRALELQSDLVGARDLLASIYMKAGQYDKAIEQCRTVLQYAPNDEAATYHLMIALRHTGKKDELQPLVKRIAELHRQSLKNETDRKRFRLEVASPPDP